jgi:hypothetical protein
MRSAALLLMMAAAVAAQTAAPARGDLETVYNKAPTAVKAKDYDVFLALVEPAQGRPAPPQAVLADAADMILSGFPDLATTKFVEIAVSGDWAGYYALTDLDGKNFVTAEDQKAVAKEIATNAGFRLPGAKP